MRSAVFVTKTLDFSYGGMEACSMPPFLSGEKDILLDRKASGLYNNIR